MNFQEFKSTLCAIIESAQSGVPVSQLAEDYRSEVGRGFWADVRQLGYSGAEDVVELINGCDGLRHNLVALTREDEAKMRGGVYSSAPNGRGGGYQEVSPFNNYEMVIVAKANADDSAKTRHLNRIIGQQKPGNLTRFGGTVHPDVFNQQQSQPNSQNWQPKAFFTAPSSSSSAAAAGTKPPNPFNQQYFHQTNGRNPIESMRAVVEVDQECLRYPSKSDRLYRYPPLQQLGPVSSNNIIDSGEPDPPHTPDVFDAAQKTGNRRNQTGRYEDNDISASCTKQQQNDTMSSSFSSSIRILDNDDDGGKRGLSKAAGIDDFVVEEEEDDDDIGGSVVVRPSPLPSTFPCWRSAGNSDGIIAAAADHHRPLFSSSSCSFEATGRRAAATATVLDLSALKPITIINDRVAMGGGGGGGDVADELRTTTGNPRGIMMNNRERCSYAASLSSSKDDRKVGGDNLIEMPLRSGNDSSNYPNPTAANAAAAAEIRNSDVIIKHHRPVVNKHQTIIDSNSNHRTMSGGDSSKDHYISPNQLHHRNRRHSDRSSSSVLVQLEDEHSEDDQNLIVDNDKEQAVEQRPNEPPKFTKPMPAFIPASPKQKK